MISVNIKLFTVLTKELVFFVMMLMDPQKVSIHRTIPTVLTGVCLLLVTFYNAIVHFKIVTKYQMTVFTVIVRLLNT